MNAVVVFALKQRVLMVALLLFVFVAGLISFTKLNIEAYPTVPPRVEVITQSPGAAAEEIERYITIPIEIQMNWHSPRSIPSNDLVVRAFRRARRIYL
jgi:heavy metal efflux system protein